MANLKPSIYQILPFDATIGTTIVYDWNEEQPYYNKLSIYNSDTKELVYVCTQYTMDNKHTLHLSETSGDNYEQEIYLKDKFLNGYKYCVTIELFDKNKQPITKSDEVVFYCFETPQFSFDEDRFDNIYYRTDEDTGITEKIGRLFSNSAYLNVTYKQVNGELIDEYQFILYDSAGNILLESQIKHGPSSKKLDDGVQINLPYKLGGVTDTEKTPDGLINDKAAYLIKCYAKTINGMLIETQIKFVVQKDMGGVGALITLTQLPNNVISISSNFKIVNAEIDGEEKYLYDAENNPFAIDLTTGESLSYFDGFVIDEPWSITAIVGNCQSNSVLMTYSNNNGEDFKISYCVKKYSLVEKAYFLFECTRQTTKYILRTNYLPISNNRWYAIYLKYENGYYTFKVYDPEDIGFNISGDSQEEIVDEILSDPNNLYAVKYAVTGSEFDDVGTYDLTYQMTVNLRDKFDFRYENYYRVSFNAENIVKNNYNEFVLTKADVIDIETDLYVTRQGNHFIIDYAGRTYDPPSLEFTLSWTNKCDISRLEERYNSVSYCVITDVVVEDILSKYYQPNRIYEHNYSPSNETKQYTAREDLNLQNNYNFIPEHTYLVEFDFSNEVCNGKGIVLDKVEQCDITFDGYQNTFENKVSFQVKENLAQTPMLVWINPATYIESGYTAYSLGIIENLNITQISDTHIYTAQKDIYFYNDTLIEGNTYEATFSVQNIDMSRYEFYLEKYLLTATIGDTTIEGTFGEPMTVRFTYNTEEDAHLYLNCDFSVICTEEELNDYYVEIVETDLTITEV